MIKCELCKKKKYTQVDIYQSMYLCDDCYSKIGRITNDYQCDKKTFEKVSSSITYKLAFGK